MKSSGRRGISNAIGLSEHLPQVSAEEETALRRYALAGIAGSVCYGTSEAL
jgi:hypothetical protein